MRIYPASLCLHQLELMVKLGYGEQERSIPQAVWVDLTFHLGNLPTSSTDDGEGFMCYDRLSARLTAAVEDSTFALIEYLARILGDIAAAWLREEAAAAGVEHAAYTIKIHKRDAPVPSLKGGASFTYTTLPSGLA